jgi:hypothetical protein
LDFRVKITQLFRHKTPMAGNPRAVKHYPPRYTDFVISSTLSAAPCIADTCSPPWTSIWRSSWYGDVMIQVYTSNIKQLNELMVHNDVIINDTLI